MNHHLLDIQNFRYNSNVNLKSSTVLHMRTIRIINADIKNCLHLLFSPGEKIA